MCICCLMINLRSHDSPMASLQLKLILDLIFVIDKSELGDSTQLVPYIVPNFRGIKFS